MSEVKTGITAGTQLNKFAKEPARPYISTQALRVGDSCVFYQSAALLSITVPDFLNKYPAELTKEFITPRALPEPQPLTKRAGAHQADKK